MKAWILRFVVMVWRMRRHQSAWFRLHKQSDLYEAKKFEKQVDDEIKRVAVIGDEGPTALLDTVDDVRPTEPKQTGLFE